DAPLLEVGRVAEVFLVETRRAHDAHPGGLGNLGHEGDITANVHRTRINKALEPEVLQLFEPVDRVLEGGAAFEFWRCAIQLPSGPTDKQVLVHESRAELLGSHGSRHGIYGFHRSNSFVPEDRGLGGEVRPARSGPSNGGRRGSARTSV